MKCTVCVSKGLKSNVYSGGSVSTLAYYSPYYDEDGKYHHHDQNTITRGYSCSLGHRWVEYSIDSCPSCDFGKDSKQIEILSDVDATASMIHITASPDSTTLNIC